MNAAQERESGQAASVDDPCLNCRNEARMPSKTACGACLNAASYTAVAESIFANKIRAARAA